MIGGLILLGVASILLATSRYFPEPVVLPLGMSMFVLLDGKYHTLSICPSLPHSLTLNFGATHSLTHSFAPSLSPPLPFFYLQRATSLQGSLA